jgi:uncharacterized cupredoxin-like copper-binding protein
VFGIVALGVAAKSMSHSNDVQHAVDKLQTAGVPLASSAKVTLEEFAITSHPAVVKAGVVTFEVDNVGTITHEMVVVRAPSVQSLPRVKQKTADRIVGDVDEEAIPEADKMGETGDVAARSHVTKKLTLTPGTYVLFCNIDTPSPGSATINHFQHGMATTITVI